MWKPPERIRWHSSLGTIPDVKEIESSVLFSPIEFGRLKLRNRTWVPAMVPWRATEDGQVTDEVLEWYGRFAKGKPAAIVIEATGIRDISSGPLLRIGHDRYIPGIQKLVERIRDESGGQTRVLIQLIDFLAIRRRPQREKFLNHHLVITSRIRDRLNLPLAEEKEIRKKLVNLKDKDLEQILDIRDWESLCKGYRERVTDMHLPNIKQLPEVLPDLFANAALRSQKAGLDGIELHYAHAYTMASFLSATNTRNDSYGGSRENRIKLPLEVFHSVRDIVSEDFIIGARFLAEECINIGSSISDVCFFGSEFARAGMDYLSLSRGGKFDDAKQPRVGEAAYPYTGQSGYECMPQNISDKNGPFGRNFSASKEIRNHVRQSGCKTPVVVAGGIHNFQIAEHVLKEDIADIVASARQSLADPDWFLKLESGYGRDIRLCQYSNYCEGLDRTHKQVTCQFWDRLNLDQSKGHLSKDGKRRLVAPDWDKIPLKS